MTTGRDRDGAMHHVLKAALRPAAGAGMAGTSPASCPEPEALAALVEGSLARPERELVEAHCATCDRCQETLAGLVRTLPVAAGTDASVPARGWLTWQPWRWAVPVTAIVALLAVWVAIRAPRSVDRQAESTVAQSLPQQAVPGEVERDTAAGPPALLEEKPPTSEYAAVPVPAGSVASGDKRVASADAPAAPGRFESDARARRAAEKPAATSGAGAVPSGVGSAPSSPPLPVPATPAPAELAGGRVAKAAPPAAAPLGEMAAAAPAVPSTAPAKRPDTLADRAAEPKVETQVKAGNVASDEKADASKAAAPAMVAHRAQETGMRALTPTASEVRAPGGDTRWRFAFGGLLFKSADAGLSWDRQDSGTTADLLAGAAPSPTVCWIVGKDGTVILTADGERWQQRSLSEAVDVVRVEARDVLTAVVTTADGRRFSTADGGLNWILAR